MENLKRKNNRGQHISKKRMRKSEIIIEKCVTANIHQGSNCFSEESRGRQCVANSLLCIVHKEINNKSLEIWTSEDTHFVLQKGDLMYRHVRISCNHSYLHPQDLPNNFLLQEKITHVSMINVYSGDMMDGFQDNGPFLSLASALNLCFANQQMGGGAIFTCKGSSVAIFTMNSKFYLFDPHARDSEGNANPECSAVLLTVCGFSNFQKLLKRVYQINGSSPFEVYRVIIKQGKNSKREKLLNLDAEMCETCNLTRDEPQCNSSLFDNNISDIRGLPKNCNYDKMISKFHASVNTGPSCVCKTCSQTWFKHSVRKATGIPEHVLCQYDIEKCDIICNTCHKYLKEGKVPPCSLMNGFSFPKRPPELDLTPLEERLVAPRIPFMQLREKPRGGQLSITGNVVNVPADVTTTIQKLPRLRSEDETIPLKFKRNLMFKHSISFENVRPNKVLNATKWLLQNSSLFKAEGIELNEDWELQCSDTEDDSEEICSTDARDSIEDNWTEEVSVDDRPTGNMDTVMQSIDFRGFNQVLSVAPGECNSPLSVFQDKNAEFLAFPVIYCGEARADNNSRRVPVHYSSICKWELRNVDRRCAKCIPNLFFKLKKLQLKQIQDKVMLAMRKCKLQGKKYTAAQILDSQTADSIVRLNEGFHVLRSLRGSPPYWEKAKKDIFAMIRQLGIPTWFCSFSAAETKWIPLLKTLGQLVENVSYTDEEISNMSWEQKSKLIKSDPVTCARYFDFRFQKFFAEVLCHKTHPIGIIEDYFYRIEFQQRGSPHVHMLVWIKDAPTVQKNTYEEVAEFVDKYITCDAQSADPHLINYQTHRHARTCMKKNKPICRFNFPIAPMPYTAVLSPLEEDDEHYTQAATDYQKVVEFLNSSSFKEDQAALSFESVLSELQISLERYIHALRSSLNQEKIFLKRNPNEVRINAFNSELLKSWQANLDIQFITDGYACGTYIVSYVSKGQRGMSNLLRQACEEARQNDSNIRQQVRRIGNKFLSHVEIGAQEAAYLVLQIPLRHTSRSVTFINTTPIEDRVVLLKPMHALEELKNDSTDVESGNIVKLYQQRPKVLEGICLADFVAWFQVKYKKENERNTASTCDELPEDVADDICSDDAITISTDSCEFAQSYLFRNGTEIIKRSKPQVLRWVNFDRETDSEKHYQELLMLFTPWRNEEKDLVNVSRSFEERYIECKGDIDKKLEKYQHGGQIVADVERALYGIDAEDLCVDFVAPNNEHEEELDREKETTLSKQWGCFDPGKQAPLYDIGLEFGVQRKQIDEEDITQLGEMNDFAYREIIRDLNEQQKEFFNHVLHWLKTKTEPLYAFLSGGAGVGKSVLTRALYQALLKFYSHRIHENPDNIHVMLCAPTGKAAHNINGTTLHSAFCIPVGKGFAYKPLDMQQLNTMRTKFISLKVIFIDEISMVGHNMLNFINLRLQEIKGCTLPFGGTSIVTVGDLFQLRPVMDNWIFTQSNKGYGPLAANLWRDNFKLFELTVIMRQRDDKIFAELLNRIREGNQTEEDMSLLKTCVKEECQEISNVPHLFTTRNEVAQYNYDIYNKADNSEKVCIKAIDWVISSCDENVKAKVLSRIPDDYAKTMGLSAELFLVIGIAAEITSNVNVQDGITNGASCIIKQFDYRVEGSTRCSIIWVQFDDEKIGREIRTEFKRLYKSGIEKNWTPILEITRLFKIQYYGTYQIKRRQFPLRLGAAKTIHKAQGSTLKAAVVHFGTRKNDHMHYVGLSRVTHIENLHIIQLNENKIKLSSCVLEEMTRLREQAKIKCCVQNLVERNAETTVFSFFNIRSLHKHIDDLKKDFNLISSDVLALSETRLIESDRNESFSLPGYTLYRFDYPCNSEQRSSYGLALYIKDQLEILNCRREMIDNIQVFLIDVILCNGKSMKLIFMHIPPKVNFMVLKNVLSSIFEQHLRMYLNPIIVTGDFNINNLSANSETLVQFMSENLKLQHLPTNSTTDYGSALDHIYTSFAQSDIEGWGTLESYYSDHKPLYITLK